MYIKIVVSFIKIKKRVLIIIYLSNSLSARTSFILKAT